MKTVAIFSCGLFIKHYWTYDDKLNCTAYGMEGYNIGYISPFPEEWLVSDTRYSCTRINNVQCEYMDSWSWLVRTAK